MAPTCRLRPLNRGTADAGPRRIQWRSDPSSGIPAHCYHCEIPLGRFAAPMNHGFAFQRSTRALFRFFSRGFRARPYLLNTREEQVVTMLLIERHRIVVAQLGLLYPGSD